MDPISLAGSAVGVLTLCLQATQTTFGLIEGMKYPEKTHKNLLQVLSELRVVLRTTESAILTETASSRVSHGLFTQLNDISKDLVDLIPKLKREKSSPRLRLLFKSRDLDVYTKHLREGVDRLHMTVVSVGAVIQASELTEIIQRQRKELASLLSLQQEKTVKTPPVGDSARRDSNFQNIDDNPMDIITQLSQLDYESKHFFHTGQRPKGSGLWILSETEYVKWLNGTRTVGARNWLWLCGNSGSGKTTLTSVVIDALLAQFRTDETVGIAFFYFDWAASITIHEVILLIIKQLCLCLPPHLNLPDEVIKIHRRTRLGRTPTLGSLVGTLSRLSTRFQRTLLIFDGLDEFIGEGLVDFLVMLKDAPCKIFAASRPKPSFQQLFEDSPQINPHVHANDIETYTSQMIENEPDVGDLLDKDLVAEINKTLITYSGNSFLLPVLQMKHILEQTSIWEIRQCLQSTPKSLDELYHRTVQRLFLQSESRSKLARRVLIWVAYAHRSLTIVELQHALAVSSKDSDINAEKFPPRGIIQASCFPLITIDPRSSFVQLSHFSIQNYLEHSRQELIQNENDEDIIARACIEYLHLAEFRVGPCSSAKTLEERLQRYPFMKYAAVNWGNHLTKSRSLQSGDQRDLFKSPPALLAANQVFFAELQVLLFDTKSLEKFSALHWIAMFGLVGDFWKLVVSGNIREVINSQDPFERTPLHWAVERNQNEMVKILLDHGADPSVLDRNNKNALHLAAKDRLSTCIHDLLGVVQQKALLQRDNNLKRPLEAAAIHGNLEAVALILEAMSTLPMTTQITKSALEGAVSNGRADVVALLLQTTELDSKDLRAGARYGFEDVVRTLFEHGANLDAADVNGMTAIHEAACGGRIEMIHFLLDNGVDIDAQAHDGCTPLIYAVRQSNRLVVEILLRQGAAINIRDKSGSTALDASASQDNLEILRLLLSYGAEISWTSNNAPNALLQAIDNQNEAMVRLLMESNVTAPFLPEGQDTALHLAAQKKLPGIVSLFLDSGLSPLAKGSRLRTPLHFAAAAGNVEIMQLLLRQGADINTRDEEGETSLVLARRSRHTEAEKFLLEHGADDQVQETIARAMHVEASPRKSEGDVHMAFSQAEGVGVGDLCVGIHFETQFLQACYGTNAHLENMAMIEWDDPRTKHSRPTHVPTRIAYPEDNDGKLDALQWGYDVDPSLVSHPSSKAFIDPESCSRLVQTHLQTSYKTATERCSDFLHQVYKHISVQLKQRYGPDLADIPITWCFTVAAVWPARSIDELRKVLSTAGFNQRPKDRITFVSESEAAALVVLTQLDADDVEPIKDGECFTICQCGDVTVDLTTYTLEAKAPRLQFAEACVGTGAICGFGAVQKRFEEWLEKIFGEAFASVPLSEKGSGSKFAAEFEDLKEGFERDGVTYYLRLPMSAPDSEHYKADEGLIKLDGSDVEQFFEPSVQMIEKLIKDQLHAAPFRSRRRPQNVFLTGSFASCRYLHERLRERFQRQGVSVLLPPKSGDAAVLGAALQAISLQTTTTKVIASRIARYHYGIPVRAPFDPEKDDQERRELDPHTGTWMVQKMEWFSAKGDKLSESNAFRLKRTLLFRSKADVVLQGKIDVFSCPNDVAPLYPVDPEVSLVTTVKYSIPLPKYRRYTAVLSPKSQHAIEITLRLDVLLDVDTNSVEVSVSLSDEENLTSH